MIYSGPLPLALTALEAYQSFPVRIAWKVQEKDKESFWQKRNYAALVPGTSRPLQLKEVKGFLWMLGGSHADLSETRRQPLLLLPDTVNYAHNAGEFERKVSTWTTNISVIAFLCC